MIVFDLSAARVLLAETVLRPLLEVRLEYVFAARQLFQEVRARAHRLRGTAEDLGRLPIGHAPIKEVGLRRE